MKYCCINTDRACLGATGGFLGPSPVDPRLYLVEIANSAGFRNLARPISGIPLRKVAKSMWLFWPFILRNRMSILLRFSRSSATPAS